MLDQNTGVLADFGVKFVGPSHVRESGLSLRQYLEVDGGKPTSRSRAILRELADGASTVVLSEENLLGAMYRGDAAQLDPLYSNADLRIENVVKTLRENNVTLMMSLRDPADYLVSTYSQALLRGEYDSFSNFVSGVNPDRIVWSNLVKRLLLIPYLSNMVIWRYEAYRQVLPQILGQFLPPQAIAQIRRPRTIVHGGLSRTAVAVARTWAEEQPENVMLAKKARKAFPVGKEHPKYAPWPFAIQEASSEAYARDWAALSQEKGLTQLTTSS